MNILTFLFCIFLKFLHAFFHQAALFASTVSTTTTDTPSKYIQQSPIGYKKINIICFTRKLAIVLEGQGFHTLTLTKFKPDGTLIFVQYHRRCAVTDHVLSLLVWYKRYSSSYIYESYESFIRYMIFLCFKLSILRGIKSVETTLMKDRRRRRWQFECVIQVSAE